MLETSWWLTLPAALGLAARGGPGPAGPEAPPSPPAFEALISNPVGPSGEIVYVSLRPGAVANGQSATIENRGTGDKVGVTIVAGGFDPATIAAGAGDTLRIEIRTEGASPPLAEAFSVPTQQGLVGTRARIYITSAASPSPRQLVPEAVAPTLPDYWDTEPAWSRAPVPSPNAGRNR